MEYRNIDRLINNFGFRLQYNRLFKPEYLPARVKYNQFFAIAVVGIWYSVNKNKVRLRRQLSPQLFSLKHLLTMSLYDLLFSFVNSRMRVKTIWAKDATIACQEDTPILLPTQCIGRALPHILIVKNSLSEGYETVEIHEHLIRMSS